MCIHICSYWFKLVHNGSYLFTFINMISNALSVFRTNPIQQHSFPQNPLYINRDNSVTCICMLYWWLHHFKWAEPVSLVGYTCTGGSPRWKHDEGVGVGVWTLTSDSSRIPHYWLHEQPFANTRNEYWCTLTQTSRNKHMLVVGIVIIQ